MTVDKLLTSISSITAGKHEWDTVERRVSYYKKCIDFYGEENAHLKNPLNDFETQHYTVARDEQHRINGNEQVNGKFLLFFYDGHDGFACVNNFDSFEKLEKHVFRYGKPNFGGFYVEYIAIIIHDDETIETKVYVNGH